MGGGAFWSARAQADVPLAPKAASSTKAPKATTSPNAASRKVALADDDASAKEPAVAKKSKPRSNTGGWHLNLEASSTMPVTMGGRLMLEMPGRIRLATTLGVLPSFYADFINAVATGAQLYDQQTGTLLKSTLQDSFVWQLQLEWRPFTNYGFYLGAGYSMAILHGTITGASIAGYTAGLNVPSRYLNALSYNVNSTLHMMSGELGWEFHFFRDVMSLRVALGFIGTVASSTTIQTQVNAAVPAQVRTAATNVANVAASAFDGMYRSYIFSPTFSLAMGFRFF